MVPDVSTREPLVVYGRVLRAQLVGPGDGTAHSCAAEDGDVGGATVLVSTAVGGIKGAAAATVADEARVAEGEEAGPIAGDVAMLGGRRNGETG